MLTRASLAFCFLAVVMARSSELDAPTRLFQKGDWKDARGEFQRVDPAGLDDGERTEREYGMAASAYHLGDYKEAIRCFSEALAENESPARGRAHFGLANTLYLGGEDDLANVAAKKSDPEFRKAMRDFLNADSMEEAEKSGKIIATDPAVLTAAQAVGKEWTEAEEHFQAALGDNDVIGADGNLQFTKFQLEKLAKLKEWTPPPPEQPQQPEKKDEPEKEEPKKDPSKNQGEGNKDKGKPEKEDGDKEKGEGEAKDDEGGDNPQQGEANGGEGDKSPSDVKEGEGEDEMNEQTGFDPNTARGILEGQSGERRDVRFQRFPYREPMFKDW